MAPSATAPAKSVLIGDKRNGTRYFSFYFGQIARSRADFKIYSDVFRRKQPVRLSVIERARLAGPLSGCKLPRRERRHTIQLHNYISCSL